MGEIWLDKTGQNNLVTKIYKFEGQMVAQLLTLETGAVWPQEQFECWNSYSWNSPNLSEEPFYRVLVG